MKRKGKININHGVQCLHFQKKNKNKKKKKKDVKLRRIQVVLYVDQQGRVKQKSGNLRSNDWMCSLICPKT